MNVSCKCDSVSVITIAYKWLQLRGYLVLWTIKQISSLGQIVQWLKRCARFTRGRRFESNSGDLSTWNQKTLVLCVLHVYMNNILLKRFKNKPTFKTTKCENSCFCCNYIVEVKLFKLKNWHQPFILKSNFNCETPNLISLVIWSGCNKEYIGQTKGQLK